MGTTNGSDSAVKYELRDLPHVSKRLLVDGKHVATIHNREFAQKLVRLLEASSDMQPPAPPGPPDWVQKLTREHAGHEWISKDTGSRYRYSVSDGAWKYHFGSSDWLRWITDVPGEVRHNKGFTRVK